MDYGVKDLKLAKQGASKIKWAEEHMPVLMNLREQLEKSKPFKGITIGMALHVTKETAALVKTLSAAGAKVSITGCNPLSTQDDVAAALVEEGISVYAWRGETNEEYYKNLEKVLSAKPDITIDDGCDLVTMVHTKRRDLLPKIIGGCEETTTGIIRLKSMHKDKKLEYPIIDVNNADTKHLFDNRYGTGQSTIDGILRSTSILISGKNFVVSGYGWCGRGVAMRAEGMGANVIITEVNPIKALEAVMDGYRVMPMGEASKIGDIFVTTTGNKDVIRSEHIKNMKDGTVLANSGHFDAEISKSDLESLSKAKTKIRENVERYDLKNGRYVYLLAEGRLVNLAAAEGHPSEVMDMSFANQALGVKYILDNKGKLKPGVYRLPGNIDEEIASIKLKSMDIKIDSLSKEQKKYLESWEEGT